MLEKYQQLAEIASNIPKELEILSQDQMGIYMIKPIHINEYRSFFEGDRIKSIITSQNLQVIDSGVKLLTKNEIYEIYKHLQLKSPFGEERKKRLVDFLTTEPVKYGIVEGEGSTAKLQYIKKVIREFIIGKEMSEKNAVMNIIHVSDLHEIHDHLKIFLKK